MISRDHIKMVWMGSLFWTLAVWGSGVWTYQRLHSEFTAQALDRMGLDLGLLHLAVWLLGMLVIHRIGRWLERRFLIQQALIEDLQTQEGRNSLALRGSRIGIWDMDFRTGGTYHSAGMTEMLGYTPAVLPSEPAAWQALTHPEDHARAESALQAHLRGESPRYEAMLRMRGHQHAWQWILVRGRAVRDAAGRVIRVLGTHTEITDLKVLQEQLQTENERASIALSSIGEAVMTTDMEGNVSFMNPMAETLTGWKLAESLGMPVEAVVMVMVMDEATRKPAPHPATLCRTRGIKVSPREGAYLVTRNGSEIAIQDSAAPILDQAGQPVGVVMVFHDVTEARELARQMSWQARHDVLTGLFSRREFERRLADLVQDARHVGSRHALLYLDLDNFKVVNDTCGHAAGDELLKQVSFLLSEPMRKNDTLARLGGDEFGILLENCPLERARDIADKLLGALSGFRFVWGAHSFDVAGSIGIAVIDAEADDAGTLLSAADVACYAAKDAGRNRAHVYEKQSDKVGGGHRDMLLARQLREAIETGRCALFAQEIRSLRGKPGRYFEVLVRMQDRHGELMSPAAFIPPAERFGLMTLMDQWVIRQTLAALGAAGPDTADIRLAVNLSALSFQDPEMPGFIRSALDSSGVDPSRLTFEITETAAMGQLSSGVRFMRDLESTGCRFALDDFGSGMSSFAYLKVLPVKVLKIDGAFVRDLLSDRADRAFVEAIHNVARTLGIETVAEYAETPELIEALRDIGVDYVQGYGVAKPRALEMILGGI